MHVINPLKRLVILQDVCTNVPISKIVAKNAVCAKNHDIKPIDVPISFALDTGVDGDLFIQHQIHPE